MSSNANTARLITDAIVIRLSENHIGFLDLTGTDRYLTGGTQAAPEVTIPRAEFADVLARIEALADQWAGFQTYKNCRKRFRNAAELISL